ncbi:hypothetical protein [Nocardioides bruguierae]|uniref:DUF11 domain-containing protein n=1 Tax=Nocardioides bruguierae TaxID=2945102 RepID=A0A9X2IH45_9ACTN|nr:hypothetical protein [Nocardioides bruguierae]MCM0622224.1 hypothetical protein [Nocardioides bruguierae]
MDETTSRWHATGADAGDAPAGEPDEARHRATRRPRLVPALNPFRTGGRRARRGGADVPPAARASRQAVGSLLAVGLAVAVLGGSLTAVTRAGLPTPEPVQVTPAAATSCPSAVSLVNGDFEKPVLAAGDLVITHESNVPGWLTTASDHAIEIWNDGHEGYRSAQGKQWAELNANMVSSLYQDVTTTPGQTLRWELLHAGRLGTDTMAVKIGPPGGELQQAQFSDPQAWGEHSGVYTVPAGQTTTRFAFVSVSAAGGNTSIGNFLDAISFGTAPCLTSTLTADTPAGDGTAHVGDVVTYRLTTTNNGGNPADDVWFENALPAGTTYVPGSLRVTTSTGTTAISDASGDDAGEYLSAQGKVRVRLGTGATSAAGGTLAPGASRVVTYQARVGTAGAGTTVTDDVDVTFYDDLTAGTLVSTTGEAAVVVAPAADLTAALSRSGAAVAGTTGTWLLQVGNDGPNDAGAVTATVTVPGSLGAVTAATPGGTCTVVPGTPTQVTCTWAGLPAGETRTVTLTGDMAPGAAAGSSLAFSAGVAGDVDEIDTGDNVAAHTSVVSTVADLGVLLAVSPDPGVAGDDVTYTATVTSTGPSVARGVQLTMPVPTGSVFVSASVPGGTCALDGTSTVVCTLPDLAAGDSLDVDVVLTLDPAGSGAVDGAVAVNATTSDPDASDNTAAVSAAGSTEADVSVVLDIAATVARPGDSVPFTLTVRNDGPSVARDVSFTTLVPAGITIVRPASPFCTPSACTIPLLGVGDEIVIAGTADIDVDAASGPGVSSTTAIASTPDPDVSDNTDSVAFEVFLDSDLAVSQSLTGPGGAADTVSGRALGITTSVENVGATRAEDVVLRVPVPAGHPVPTVTDDGGGSCSFVGTVTGGLALSGGTVVCQAAQVAAGDTWTVVLASSVPAWFDGAWMDGSASVATDSDSTPGNDQALTTIAVSQVADLAVAQSVPTGDQETGSTVEVTVTVTNAGPSDAHDVVLVEQTGPGIVVTGGTADVGSTDPASGDWTIPHLAVGETATATMTLTGWVPGTYDTVVEIATSDVIDPDGSNDRSTASLTWVAPVVVTPTVTVTATETATETATATATVTETASATATTTETATATATTTATATATTTETATETATATATTTETATATETTTETATATETAFATAWATVTRAPGGRATVVLPGTTRTVTVTEQAAAPRAATRTVTDVRTVVVTETARPGRPTATVTVTERAGGRSATSVALDGTRLSTEHEGCWCDEGWDEDAGWWTNLWHWFWCHWWWLLLLAVLLGVLAVARERHRRRRAERLLEEEQTSTGDQDRPHGS